jgi:tetratricopeptide (TPR) repeat protein
MRLFQPITIFILFVCISSCRFQAEEQPESPEKPEELLLHQIAYGSDDKALDQLFAQLKVARDPEHISMTRASIQEIWMQSGDQEVDSLMDMGVNAIYRNTPEQAASIFSRVIDLMPEYAEAWNKRASVHYLQHNHEQALADAGKTLELEPRHFGALSGKASILIERGRRKEALEVYRKLEKILPLDKSIQDKVTRLKGELGFRKI